MENINNKPVDDRKDKYLKTKEQLITATPDIVGVTSFSWSLLGTRSPQERGRGWSEVSP